MFQTNKTSGLYFFYLFGENIPEKSYSEKPFPKNPIRKNHSRKILFGKISFRNYQSSRRWFLGMNSLSPCFTPNASYHASM